MLQYHAVSSGAEYQPVLPLFAVKLVWIHTSSEFCTQHGNDFGHSASARTKPNLEHSGLGESRLRCFVYAVSNICDFALRFWVAFSETGRLYRNPIVTVLPSWNRGITCSLKSFSFPPTNRRALEFTTSLRSKCLSGIALWPCQIDVHTCCIRDACVLAYRCVTQPVEWSRIFLEKPIVVLQIPLVVLHPCFHKYYRVSEVNTLIRENCNGHEVAVHELHIVSVYEYPSVQEL